MSDNGTSVVTTRGGVGLPAPQRGREIKATMKLGPEMVAVRLGPDGFMTRAIRRIRLEFGPHLYAATTSPKDGDKVVPYQPGYMALVHAAGGHLTCPPAVRDVVSGDMRPNPFVETYPDTGIVRRVTATAVCAVPHPITGEWVVSNQTVVQDAEAVLHQALLKIAREDAVRTMSWEDYQEGKGGDLKGWVAFPLMPPFVYIVANMRNPAVIGAFQTFREQATTIRQRACSKAERLAADHNPVTRKVWLYGTLQFDHDTTGELLRPPYVDVDCVAWVKHEGREAAERFIRALAEHQAVDGVGQMLVGEPVPVAGDDEGPEDDVEIDVPPSRPRQLPTSTAPAVDLRADLEAARAREPEPAPRLPPAPEPTPVAEAAPQPEREREALLAEIRVMERRMEPEQVRSLRLQCGITTPPERLTLVAKIRAYRNRLVETVGA